MIRESEPIARWLDDSPGLGDGPLAGMRVGVKEMICVAGVGGSPNSEVIVPQVWRSTDIENSYVTALRRAGSSIVATTTSHEFAWGPEHPRGSTCR